MAQCQSWFAACDLVFFDSDNGFEASSAYVGREAGMGHVFTGEIAAFYGRGQSVLFHRPYPPMLPRVMFRARQVARLRDVVPSAAVWTFSTTNRVFFQLVHPASPLRVTAAAMQASGQW